MRVYTAIRLPFLFHMSAISSKSLSVIFSGDSMTIFITTQIKLESGCADFSFRTDYKYSQNASDQSQSPRPPLVAMCYINETLHKRHHGNNACIFPESFKMMKIFLAFPIGTASVEQSFRPLKTIKTRLRSFVSDCSVAQLMRILIEGPEIDAVEFEEVLEIFKEHNHRLLL